jgi:DNA-binding LacI/PurR family transcriptional regulator
MVWHDGMAIRLIQCLKEAGLQVPKDISVAAVDNAWDAKDAGIELTTVDNPLHEIGMRAASMAIDRVLDPSLPSEIIKLPPKLMVKATTADCCGNRRIS